MTDVDADSISRLAARFAIAGAIDIVASPLGGPVVELRSPQGACSVALKGAQVLSWQPAGHEPVLWLSDASRLDADRPVRGGVPVCWPWFGPSPAPPLGSAAHGWSQHGFARAAMWTLSSTRVGASGPEIVLRLSSDDGHAGPWPFRAEAALTVTLGPMLELALETQNTGKSAFPLTQALHTYFHVSDVAEAVVERLEGHAFHDALELGPALSPSTHLKSQMGAIPIDQPVNRIYIQHTGGASIHDRWFRRRIAVDKAGSRSTVVWTPGEIVAGEMGDFGGDGWRRMVCVETANTVYDPVELAPGARHVLRQVISVSRV